MTRSKWARRVVVSADGVGVVSHAGVGVLHEMAEYTAWSRGVTAALLDTYQGTPVHASGRVFTDLAVAVADGADAISGISVLGHHARDCKWRHAEHDADTGRGRRQPGGLRGTDP